MSQANTSNAGSGLSCSCRSRLSITPNGEIYATYGSLDTVGAPRSILSRASGSSVGQVPLYPPKSKKLEENVYGTRGTCALHDQLTTENDGPKEESNV